MTAQQGEKLWGAMTPRERDGYVALFALDYVYYNLPSNAEYAYAVRTTLEEGGSIRLIPASGETGFYERPSDKRPFLDHQLPRFTTDVGAAWEVVEKLRELGYLVTLKDMCPDGTFFWDESRVQMRAFCGLTYMREGVGIDERVARGAMAVGDHPAEAICLAALRVLGKEPGYE